MMPFLKGLTGSLVNPMASIWGVHATWKMALAGALHVLYPFLAIGIAWIALRAVNRRSPVSQALNTKDHASVSFSSRALVAAIVSIVGIPLLFFIVNSIFILIESLTSAPKSAAELLQLSQRPGFAWVLDHPIPAIHHAYAATIYFYSSLSAALLYVLSIPISRALVGFLGREAVVRAVSAFLTIAGILIAVLC
jgi:hypothetical protein